MKASLLVVCPTYAERDNLEALSDRLWRFAPEALLLVVDDASGDGTPDWVRRHPAWGEQLHLISRPAKLGLGSAYRDGFLWALDHGAEHILQIDADLSHDPADVPRLAEEARRGTDLVLGTRDLRAARNPGRKALSQLGAKLCHRLLGLPVSDPTGGFKCWRREALLRLEPHRLRCRGFAFQIESTYRAWQAGLSIAEVPIETSERRQGTSKLDAAIVGEALLTLLRLALEREPRHAIGDTSFAR